MATEEIIDDFLSKGKYSFTLDEFRKAYNSTNTSVKRVLSKLSKKGRIRSIKKGFYVIVTPEYKSSIIPPVTDLLDGLMNDFNKAYYLGLLSAAALHGAAHQQPLVSMVVIPKPALRNINLKNHKIKFLTKSKWLQQGVIRKNVRTGYINISNPALTAIDLIQYQTKCGGISRIYDVLSELHEVITKTDLKSIIRTSDIKKSVLQRAGFLLDYIGRRDLGQIIFDFLQNKKFSYVPLREGKVDGEEIARDHKWRIIINTRIDSDL